MHGQYSLHGMQCRLVPLSFVFWGLVLFDSLSFAFFDILDEFLGSLSPFPSSLYTPPMPRYYNNRFYCF